MAHHNGEFPYPEVRPRDFLKYGESGIYQRLVEEQKKNDEYEARVLQARIAATNVVYPYKDGQVSVPVKEGGVVEIPNGVDMTSVTFQTEKLPQTGLRYNAGKPELSMVLEADKAMAGVAKVLMYGRDKYHRGNWLGGLHHMGIVDCLMRHLTAHVSGEDLDAESGLPHVDHVLANALFLSQMYHTRPDLDDRATENKKC